MAGRRQLLTLIIAANGYGKTYLQVDLAIQYIEACPEKRVLFVLADDGEDKTAGLTEIGRSELLTFTGVKKYIIEDASDFEYLADLFKSYRDDKTGLRVQRKFNGMMCCDDLGGAMNRRPKEILNFFKKRRQPNIDFLFAFHGLKTDVPPSFYTYVTSIILGRTSDNHNYTKDLLAEDKQDEFEQAYRRVQKETLTNPYYKEEIIINPITI